MVEIKEEMRQEFSIKHLKKSNEEVREMITQKYYEIINDLDLEGVLIITSKSGGGGSFEAINLTTKNLMIAHDKLTDVLGKILSGGEND